MHIEIDQSGKIEQLNKDSVIAFSNKNQYSVLIPKSVKQEAYNLYKGKIKELRYRLFCIAIYYCLRDYTHGQNLLSNSCPFVISKRHYLLLKFLCLLLHIKGKELITICCEYKGKENLIKSLLLSYLRKDSLEIDSRVIRFGVISKKSNAHAVAIDAFRGNRRPNKILSLNEVEKCLKK